jgi:two-component system, LytTR family, response regulator
VRVLNALIVDDEPRGRDRIRMLLRPHTGVVVAGECRDGVEAVAAIRDLQPDVVFLDVQMPELDGFGVIEQLAGAPLPFIIFVTAYDEHAIRAFEVNAVDYLLKPVSPERFSAAVERVRHEALGAPVRRNDPRIDALLAAVQRTPREWPTRLVVRSRGAAHFVHTAHIHWIEAADNYIRLHTTEGVHLLRETLKEIEARLDPNEFVRIRRSAIVNLEFVQRVEPWGRGEYLLILADGTRLNTSRAFGEPFRRLLE